MGLTYLRCNSNHEKEKNMDLHTPSYVLVQRLTEDFILNKLKFKRVTLFETNISFVGYTVKDDEIHMSVHRNEDGTYDVLSIQYGTEDAPDRELNAYKIQLHEVKNTLLQHKLHLAVAKCIMDSNFG